MVSAHNSDKSTDFEQASEQAQMLALSRLMDADLNGEALQKTLDLLMSDPQMQRQWSEHHCVGDALRSSEVGALHGTRFLAVMDARLEQEPHHFMLKDERSLYKFNLRTMLPLAAVAAAVAVVVGVVPQFLSSPTVAPLTTASTQSNEQRVSVLARNLQSVRVNPAAQASPPMNIYLQAHREFVPGGVLPTSAPYLRTSAAVPAGADQ